jgi:hypothetical protein
LKIFTLAVLLSSVVIYNQKDAIDEQSISSLSVVADMSRIVRSSSSSSGSQQQQEDGNDNLNKFTPKLIWLLRDFSLEMKNEKGVELTSDEYMVSKVDCRFERSEKIIGFQPIKTLIS